MWLILFVLAGCNVSPIGQPCASSPFILENNPCPTGFACKYESACDSDYCVGTCVYSCASAPCPGSCHCTMGASLRMGCIAIGPDAGTDACE